MSRFSKYSADLVRVLAHGLAVGENMKALASLVNIQPRTLADWIDRGAHDERFAELPRALERGREERRSREQVLAEKAAELLARGLTLRATAFELGVSYDCIRSLLRHAGAGEPGLERLHEARPVCSTCGHRLKGKASATTVTVMVAVREPAPIVAEPALARRCA